MNRYAKAKFKYAKAKNKNVKANLKNVKAFSGKNEKPFNFFKMQKHPSNKSVEANLLIHNTNS